VGALKLGEAAMPVQYLVYVSQAGAGVDNETVAEIIATSRRYNAGQGITGLLLFVPGRDAHVGSFMQLLEGDEAEVERLRKKIFDDPRHHTKVVISRGTRNDRCFPDWSMALKTADPETLEYHPVLSKVANVEFLRTLSCGPEADGVVTLLTDFWDADPIE